MLPAHGYDFVQWAPGRRKLFESNYLKANSPDGERALWIKHNILAPADAAREPVLEVWCVLFDKAQGRPRALKQILPMSHVLVSKTGLRIESDGVLLTDRLTRTTLRQKDGREASWDLGWETLAGPLFHFPSNRFYTAPLPKKKIMSPAPRLRMTGWLSFDGERIEVQDWVGLRGHNWGTEHAHTYAYGNCNRFPQDDLALIDAFTARIRVGPLLSPWLSMAVLRQGGHQLDFNAPRHTLTRSAEVAFPHWRVTLTSRHGVLATRWELDPAQTIGLRYLHPDGKLSYCYNTKFARLEVRLGHIHLTSDQAELEFLFPEPVPGIELHGEERV